MYAIDWNTWGPPLAVLILGAIVGIVAALRVQGGADSRPVEAREALLSRKESLVEQLKEHDSDRSKMDEAAWSERRENLLAEAAGVLRQLDEGPEDVEFEVAGPSGRGLTASWIVGLLVFCGVAAGLVSQFAKPRVDGGGGQMSVDPWAEDIAHAEAALRADPNDMEAINLLTHIAIERKELESAMGLIDRGRAVAPEDTELKIHLDALRLLVGMGAKAEVGLKEVLEKDPESSEAMRWLSYALFQQGDIDGAASWLEKAMTVGSERDRALAEVWLMELRSAQVAAEEPQVAVDEPRVPASSAVQGQVILADGASAPEGGRLFVLARASETERGPPLAAIRLGTPELPTDFSLGTSDLIRGGAWPDEVWLKARWSAGGDPMTPGPGDLVSAVLGPISAGSSDLSLVLEPAAQ